ncbi:MAG TPA: hypothetical protein VG055_32820 [Planctomycetaceae bacterium]|nr:hypothetical protein [Planctomycetaceae bacterium]
MTAITNPGLPGPFAFDSVVYASAGLNYAAVPALAQYVQYDTPDPAYVTPRINLSAFAELGSAPWPFANTAVPLNGHIRIPQGRGPFPLAVFVHGNHDPLSNSAPGYLYLCDLLASRGVIAATIDVNFLNGFNFGENDGRAVVHLEHLKQFRTWNAQAGHPLCGKINLNRLMIVGHSRGGEGVGHASFFNRLAAIQPDAMHPVVPLNGSAGLGPYRFNLSLVAAIAPTDGQYTPLTGPTVVPDSYFLIHGSRDGDVSTFSGYDTYNRAHGVDLANATSSDVQFKSLLWVYRANHNQFNTTWRTETPGTPTLTRAEQEQVAKVQFGSLTAAVLLGRSEYREVVRDHAAASAWMPPRTVFVSQYQDPERVFILHNQESLGAPQVSLPVQGTVATDSVVPLRQFFDLAHSGGPQVTISLRLTWTASPAKVLMVIDPETLPAESYNVLSLRVGQSNEAGNTSDRDQDFTVEVSSGTRTAAILASSLHRLRYPDVVFGAGKTVMQTLRLPMQRLIDFGIDPRDLRSIALVFDRRPTGVVYVGDLQVCN